MPINALGQESCKKRVLIKFDFLSIFIQEYFEKDNNKSSYAFKNLVIK